MIRITLLISYYLHFVIYVSFPTVIFYFLLQCSSIPADSISAPIGGFRLESRSSISSIQGNWSKSFCIIRPLTCSSNFEGTAISFSITLSIHGPILHFLGPLVSRYIHNSWAQASALLLITLSICLLLTPVFLKVIPQMVAQKDLLKVKQDHTKKTVYEDKQ